MKLPRFGRRAVAPNGSQTGSMAHEVLLETLKEKDRSDPKVRLQLAGQAVFQETVSLIQSDRGVRIEDMLGILAATGGFSCVVGAMDIYQRVGLSGNREGLVQAVTDSGETYYYGELPNQLLWESPLSLLSLTLGIAQAKGGSVSAEMVRDVFIHVAGTVGEADFGVPRLPDEHMPGDLPINYVKHIWPNVRAGLDNYEVPVEQRATALGFAVQQAITAGASAIDPTMAAKIVIEYAIPMAKLDPAKFDRAEAA